MTPTNYVWPASQDRVPSVWCCPTPHWLVNEGLRGGVRAGVVVVVGERRSRRRRGLGWASLRRFNCRPVSGQLLIHSSFATTTNRGHTRAGRQSSAGSVGHWQAVLGPPTPCSNQPTKKKPQRSISPLSLRKQSCLYWAQSSCILL